LICIAQLSLPQAKCEGYPANDQKFFLQVNLSYFDLNDDVTFCNMCVLQPA